MNYFSEVIDSATFHLSPKGMDWTRTWWPCQRTVEELEVKEVWMDYQIKWINRRMGVLGELRKWANLEIG